MEVTSISFANVCLVGMIRNWVVSKIRRIIFARSKIYSSPLRFCPWRTTGALLNYSALPSFSILCSFLDAFLFQIRSLL
jgi:hypothetical protein